MTIAQEPEDGKPSGPAFSRRPLTLIDDIPVFSKADRYIDNYRRIADDHLVVARQGGGNPNIEEGLWLQIEESTRKLVTAHAKVGDKVLDAGVGLGRVLAPLNDLRRYGVDISLEYLKIARDNGFDVAFARLEEMPYESEQFDMVLACDVFEHVIDLHACCTQLVRVLRKGGTLIVRVPYLDDLDAYLNEDLPYELIHLRRFDLPGMRLLFSKIYGMEYLEHSFVAPFLKGHPRMKLRLLKEDDRARRRSREEDRPELEVLRRATQVTAEEYLNWLYDLCSRRPELFAEMADALVEPLEMNLVFRKR